MKYILYVLTHRSGDIETFQIKCQQNESDLVNLRRFEPENLAGKAKKQLRDLVKCGYSLSNWHVITP